MTTHEIRDGVWGVGGRLPKDMMGLIASNAYVIESDEGLVVYDPSCGARVGKEIATLIEQRGPLENLWVIIGHSHFDHAANLHVADHGTVARRHIIAHEAGFVGDTIANSAEQTYRSGIRKAQATYDPYRAAFGATRAIQAPFALTHTVAPIAQGPRTVLTGSLSNRNPEVPAGLVDVPNALSVLKDSLLAMNLSLIVGPSDLLGHHLL